ncbi:Aste57867_21289 [Aphanomyces stellatus]|uniref:Aste57867_21289 protein n=1 Tax=Aphanomyces stellatus TaxID=120398 RepID=A0A485LJ85_9STRA|nr:hypothetical protein As57867_021220 [Aphanomyces stellatus]VFT97961.1 Aste57867_21289 [Aphanomyces stellatus]
MQFLYKTPRMRRTLSSTIPRPIHQSWKTIPSKFEPWMQCWRAFNPALFETRFPTFLATAQSLSKIQLADFSRVALLYEYCGIYVDGDFECLASFSDLLHYPLFLSREPLVHAFLLDGVPTPRLWNAILASQPRHPFWLEILHAIQHKVDAHEDMSDPIALTGPGVFESVNAKWSPSSAADAVLPEEFFYPEIAA